MQSDQKVRIAVMFASAAIPLLAAALAVHGVIITPLDEIGGALH